MNTAGILTLLRKFSWAILLVALAGPALAGTTSWTGATGDWFNANNWDSGVPIAANSATIDNGGTAEIPSGSAEALSLSLGVLAGGGVVHTGGTSTVGGQITLGAISGANGTYELGNDAQLSANRLLAALFGQGSFVQNGQSVVTMADNVTLAQEAGSSGSYELHDTAQLQVPHTLVGVYGTGEFHHGGDSHSGEDLCLGRYAGSHGTYEMSGGELVLTSAGPTSERLIVGWEGTGVFRQTQGVVALDKDLDLGFGLGASGTYELGGGQLSAEDQVVGGFGAGVFRQTGGINTVQDRLSVGNAPDGGGTYELSDGQVQSARLVVGQGGTGLFIQTGGTNTALDSLELGIRQRTHGTYELSGGLCAVDGGLRVGGFCGSDGLFRLEGTARLQVGVAVHIAPGDGPGRFDWFGGVLDTPEMVLSDNTAKLAMGFDFDLQDLMSGALFEHGGTLSGLDQGLLYVTNGATATQTGIPASLHVLVVGSEDGYGRYELSGAAQLSTYRALIGSGGAGDFVQHGGTHVAQSLTIGIGDGGEGTYVLAGGSLAVGWLYLGESGMGGALEITDPAASMTISDKLYLGWEASLAAAPGATVHMTGAAFENECIVPARLAGLANLTLIFEGGSADIDPFEVGGMDMGPVMDGFVANFALGTFTLGGIDIGQVQLVNDFDNQRPWICDEALYVYYLNVGAGSYLDLNGLNLYFLNAQIDPAATIVLNGGSLMQIPEPGVMSLLAIGAVALMRRRKRQLGR